MNDNISDWILGAIMLALLAATGMAAWGQLHPTPDQIVRRQQTEQRQQEDKDIAEWNRAQQLRDMRADKARAEQPENKKSK
jgi:hypothetical protein